MEVCDHPNPPLDPLNRLGGGGHSVVGQKCSPIIETLMLIYLLISEDALRKNLLPLCLNVNVFIGNPLPSTSHTYSNIYNGRSCE